MITPFIVKRDTPNRYDYPYSGSLYVIKTFHAANPGKKINLETQWVAGVMGPPSFCKQVDILFHKTFPKNIRPGGWGFQLPTDLLLNYNFSEEKQIISLKKIASLSEGGQLSLGTMRTGLSLYLLFRSGDSSGAFQGFIEQFFSGKKNKLNVHVSFKPGVDLVVYNALLDGGIFNRLSPLRDKDSPYGSLLKRSLMVGYLQFSALVGFRKYSVSFTQTANSPEYRGFRSHQYANISVNFRW